MDEPTAQRVLDALIAYGLAHDDDGDVAPSRKWSAKLQAAAETINLEIERAGVAPEGNPLMLATSKALKDLGFPQEDFDDAVRMLVLMEVARMKPEARAKYGFGELAL